MTVNPNAIFLVAFTTVLGALLGIALWGALVGLGICLIATVWDK